MINYDRKKRYMNKPIGNLFAGTFFTFISVSFIYLYVVVCQNVSNGYQEPKFTVDFKVLGIILLCSTVIGFISFLISRAEFKSFKTPSSKYFNIIDMGSSKLKASLNFYQLVEYRLKITSIKTANHKDIKDFHYSSEMKIHSEYIVEVEGHQDKNFILKRDGEKSGRLIDLIIDIYLDKEEVYLIYEPKEEYLEFHAPIGKFGAFDLIGDVNVDDVRVEESVTYKDMRYKYTP